MQLKFHFLSSVQEATLLGSIIVRPDKGSMWQGQERAARRSTAWFSTRAPTPRPRRPRNMMHVWSLWYGFLRDRLQKNLSKSNGWVERGMTFQTREVAS
jgi:hypothetical protein